MSRSSTLAVFVLAISATACSDDVAIGQACLPAAIPCDSQGQNCGFRAQESYLYEQFEACASGVCVVHRLDNGTAGARPSDPRVLCTGDGQPAGCVTQAALDAAAYCSCRCARNGEELRDACTCGDGYVCELGFAGTEDAYCVKQTSRD